MASRKTISRPGTVCRVLAVAALVCATAGAAGPIDPALISSARDRVRSYFKQLPDYVCGVGIERFVGGPKGKLRRQDRLRVEVAFVGGTELYALPGSTSFDHTALADIIPYGGAISTGSYAIYLHEIFLNRHVEFTRAERITANGSEHVELDFHIPAEYSSARVSDSVHKVIAAVDGSVRFAAGTFALEQLQIDFDNLPPEVRVAKSTEITHYHDVKVGDHMVRLPSSTELLAKSRSGDRMRNLVTFENCHRYGSEATITFDTPAETPATAAAPPPTIEVPHKADVTLALDTRIHTGSAIGEEIEFHVVEGNRALRGAVVHGHLSHLSAFTDGRRNHWMVVGLRLETIEMGGGPRVEFAADLMTLASNFTGSQRSAFRLAEMGIEQKSGEIVFMVSDREFPVRPGLRTVWRTR